MDNYVFCRRSEAEILLWDRFRPDILVVPDNKDWVLMKTYHSDIRIIREQLVNAILKSVVFLGSVALFGSLSRVVLTGWRPVMYSHVGAYLAVLAVALFGQRIPYVWRAALLLILMFMLAVTGLLTWGLTGTAILILAALLVFITLLWGLWPGIIAAGVSLLVVAVIGWGVSSGKIVFVFDARAYHLSPSSWINAVTSCFLYFGVIVGCTGYVNNRLLALSADYRKKYNDLAEVNKRLEESETRYRTLFDTARDAIFIMKGDRFIDCNPRALEIFYCSREEILNTSPLIWSPEYQANGNPTADEVEKLVSAAYGGWNQVFEWRHRRKDGELFDVEVSLSQMEIYDTTHLLAIVRDITYRKKAEAEMRLNAETQRRILARQSLILDSLPMAFYTSEMAGPYGRTWVSEQVNRISGFTSQQFTDDRNLWRSRIHPDDYPSVMDTLDSLSARDHVSMEYRWEHADGSYHWFEDHAVLVRDENGVLQEIIGTWLDVSDEKKALTERERLEKQLMQSQKMEVIGTLTGGIAHDFNNILFPMIGYLEMILKSLPAEDVLHRRVGRVLEGARRAESLVRQILSVSRRTEEEAVPLNVGTVVKEAADLSRSSLPASIEIFTDIDMNLGEVVASPTHIHQIVMNLVTNAYHAMQENGGRLGISLKPFYVYEESPESINLKPGDYVLLSVSDSGKGMTPDIVQRVFDPYFTTKDSGKGTGLGLFVVHGLVNKYGGLIQVESEPGKGTLFRICFPVSRSSGKALAPQPLEETALAGDESILIVDDEQSIINMFHDYLMEYGYKVLTRGSSREALALMQSEGGSDVALLITDMVMPEMNGLELAHNIHSMYPDLPVILMTGYSEQITTEKLIKAGISETMLKPVSPVEILKMIRKLLTVQPL